ncbi:hypothetical protein [Halorarum halobium]|uniref:hypothetical protein n=1 Tax=Halorarum halobium TaxID=3075121 RepID=UPI0028A71E20|nr:hypothetical protein [Halobaculum sp. XH14]
MAEVAEVARCEEPKVRLGYRVLNAELGLDAKPRQPPELVARLASAVEQRAQRLARDAVDAGIANGRNPNGVAAACVYVAGIELAERVTQAELADLADVTPVTIRNRVRELQALSHSN